MFQEFSKLFKRDVSSFSYSQPTGILQTWTSFAKAIRVGMRTSYKYAPVPMDLKYANIDEGRLFNYYLLFGFTMALLGVSFLYLVFSAFCSMCPRCRTKKRRKWFKPRPSTPFCRACSVVSLIIIAIVIVICCVFAVLLSYYLDTVLANFITGALSSLQSAFLLSQELTPAFNLAFNSLETIVNVSTSGIFQHVTFDAVNNSISPALFVLAAAMNQIEANRTSAASLATINDLNVTTIGSLVAQITSLVAQIDGNITLYAIPVTGHTSYHWDLAATGLTDTASTTCGNIHTLASALPVSSTILGTLATSNFSSYVSEVNSTAKNLYSIVYSLMYSGTSNFLTNITTDIESSRSDVVSIISPLADLGAGLVSYYRNETKSYLEYFISYKDTKNWGIFGLASIYIVVFFCFCVCILARSPGSINRLNCVCTPFYIVFHLMAAIMAMFAIFLGDACTLLYEGPPYIVNYVDNSTALMIQNTFTGADLCYQNKSLYDVLLQTNLFNASNYNLTKVALDKINGFNFTSVESGWNISTSLSFSSDPTTKFSTVTGLNLSQFDLTNLNSLSTTKIPLLISQLQNINTTLGYVSSNLTAYLLTTDYASVYNLLNLDNGDNLAGIANAAGNDYQTMAATIYSQMYQLIGPNGLVYQLNSSVIGLASQIVTLNNTAISMIAQVPSVTSAYSTCLSQMSTFASNASANLTVAVPAVQQTMLSSIGGIQTVISDQYPCFAFSQAFTEFQDSICGGFSQTFDGWWISSYVISILSFLSVPITKKIAKVLLNEKPSTLEREDDLSEESIDDKKSINSKASKTSREISKKKDTREMDPDEISPASDTKQLIPLNDTKEDDSDQPDRMNSINSEGRRKSELYNIGRDSSAAMSVRKSYEDFLAAPGSRRISLAAPHILDGEMKPMDLDIIDERTSMLPNGVDAFLETRKAINDFSETHKDVPSKTFSKLENDDIYQIYLNNPNTYSAVQNPNGGSNTESLEALAKPDDMFIETVETDGSIEKSDTVNAGGEKKSSKIVVPPPPSAPRKVPPPPSKPAIRIADMFEENLQNVNQMIQEQNDKLFDDLLMKSGVANVTEDTAIPPLQNQAENDYSNSMKQKSVDHSIGGDENEWVEGEEASKLSILDAPDSAHQSRKSIAEVFGSRSSFGGYGDKAFDSRKQSLRPEFEYSKSESVQRKVSTKEADFTSAHSLDNGENEWFDGEEVTEDPILGASDSVPKSKETSSELLGSRSSFGGYGDKMIDSRKQSVREDGDFANASRHQSLAPQIEANISSRQPSIIPDAQPINLSRTPSAQALGSRSSFGGYGDKMIDSRKQSVREDGDFANASRHQSLVPQIEANISSRQPSLVPEVEANISSRQPSLVPEVEANISSRQPSLVPEVEANISSRQPSLVPEVEANISSRQPSIIPDSQSKNVSRHRSVVPQIEVDNISRQPSLTPEVESNNMFRHQSLRPDTRSYNASRQPSLIPGDEPGRLSRRGSEFVSAYSLAAEDRPFEEGEASQKQSIQDVSVAGRSSRQQSVVPDEEYGKLSRRNSEFVSVYSLTAQEDPNIEAETWRKPSVQRESSLAIGSRQASIRPGVTTASRQPSLVPDAEDASRQPSLVPETENAHGSRQQSLVPDAENAYTSRQPAIPEPELVDSYSPEFEQNEAEPSDTGNQEGLHYVPTLDDDNFTSSQAESENEDGAVNTPTLSAKKNIAAKKGKKKTKKKKK